MRAFECEAEKSADLSQLKDTVLIIFPQADVIIDEARHRLKLIAYRKVDSMRAFLQHRFKVVEDARVDAVEWARQYIDDCLDFF